MRTTLFVLFAARLHQSYGLEAESEGRSVASLPTSTAPQDQSFVQILKKWDGVVSEDGPDLHETQVASPSTYLELRQAPAAAGNQAAAAAAAQQANAAHPAPADPADQVTAAVPAPAAAVPDVDTAKPATTAAVPAKPAAPAAVPPDAAANTVVPTTTVAPVAPANPGAAAVGAVPAPSSAPPPGVTIQAPSVTVVNGVPYTQEFSSVPNPGTSPQVGHIGLGSHTSAAGAENTKDSEAEAQSENGAGPSMERLSGCMVALAVAFLVGVTGIVL